MDQCDTPLLNFNVLPIKEPVARMCVSWGTADAWTNYKLPLQYLSQELTFHAGRIRKYLFMNQQKLFTNVKKDYNSFGQRDRGTCPIVQGQRSCLPCSVLFFSVGLTVTGLDLL